MKQIVRIILAIIVFTALSRPVYAVEPAMSDPSAKPIAMVAEADFRPIVLKAYLTAKHSPMADDAEFFVSEADRLNLDWKLVAAIAGVESTFGQHIPSGSYNAWGWGVFTGTQDGVHFSNWRNGITSVSEGLQYRYMAKGANTVDKIGYIYAASPVWSYKVKSILSDIETFYINTPKSLAVTI